MVHGKGVNVEKVSLCCSKAVSSELIFSCILMHSINVYSHKVIASFHTSYY